MGANELIFTLREGGFSINTENSRLQIAPAKKLTDELKKTITQSKPEILCALHQEDELTHLVRLVSDHEGFTETEHKEALEGALADPANAIICFSSLVRRIESIKPCNSVENGTTS